MEAMCHNMSNETGKFESHIYNILQEARDRFDQGFKDLVDYHNQRGGYVKNLMLPPEKRSQSLISDIERKAYLTVKDEQVLVFGHTHRPFISKDLKLVNSGCWVKDAEINNTFVELEENDIKIFKFKDKDTSPEDITSSLTWDLNAS